MTHYVYAGTAPLLGQPDPEQPSGLFRQVVGEQDWQPLSTGLPDLAEVRAIAIHPATPQLMYAGTQQGPYRSTDSGDHWERLPFPDDNMTVWTIVFHPHNPGTLYLGTAPPAVYRSDNGGDSWRKLPIVEPAGMVDMGFPCRVLRLAIDPGNPDEIYAGLEVGGVICSLDGGGTWDDCTKGLLALSGQEHLKSRILSDTDAEGMMDTHALNVSAARPGTVFLATRMGLFCSPDRGQDWQEMGIWKFSPMAYARDIQVAPDNPDTLYAALSSAAIGLNGSVYRSLDVGQTWQRFDHDMTVRSTVMTVAPSRQDPQRVYYATSGGQVFSTPDGGTSWQESQPIEGRQAIHTLACV